MNSPKISIITPVYNMLPYLKQCVYSVKDQQVSYEHIVVDGDSTDGTKDWLKKTPGLKWISGVDNGMYDALNKGLSMTQGEIIGHINADEQYLTGTLNYVVDYFDKNPDIDFVVADFLVVDKHGELIAYRKSFPAFWPFFFSNYLYAFTCTLFYRKKVVEDLRYNSNLKSIADTEFLYKIQKQGFKGAHMRKFVAAFTYTGNNLSLQPYSILERNEYEKRNLPTWFKLTRIIFRFGFYLSRIVYGTFWHKGSITYDLYDRQVEKSRKRYVATKPSWKLTH